MKINIFWFRRDLRFEDNSGLDRALMSDLPVLPLFIVDTVIQNDLSQNDPRISFIYDSLVNMNSELLKSGSAILVRKGKPSEIWREIIISFEVHSVYFNKEYDPWSVDRDKLISGFLTENSIGVYPCKDSVIFEEKDILKPDSKPYSVFTPYKKRWINKLLQEPIQKINLSQIKFQNFLKINIEFPSLKSLGYKQSEIKVRPWDLSVIRDYNKFRDYPFDDKTSYLGPHLRFGTISIRMVVNKAIQENETFLSELIWREFFMQILFNFPKVTTGNFKNKYDFIEWRNNEIEFERWCTGETGYPIIDAGMRQLNETGYMHNRVRMLTAGFLCKHLLIDWRWGEAWFAGKLLDYELSSNNGNWQWAAGTGCDAAPYFRIFNPHTQAIKFDSRNHYIKKWCPEYSGPEEHFPIVDHSLAAKRAIEAYRKGIRT